MGATLTWEKGRQLKSYSKGNLSITYKYNTDGLRTEKNVNGTVYNYVWRDSKLVHQSGDNKNIHFYYDVDDSIVGFECNGYKYTYIKNIQGDIVGILDESGNTVATYTYDAWGNVLTATGDLAEINPIRYRGYYYDNEINMYYLQSRYYDQNVGRFINADDVILIQYLSNNSAVSLNLFTYCENNIVNISDIEGNFGIVSLMSKLILGAIFGVFIQIVTDFAISILKTVFYGKSFRFYPSDVGDYFSTALSWSISVANPFSTKAKIIKKLFGYIPLIGKYAYKFLSGQSINWVEFGTEFLVVTVSIIISYAMNAKAKSQINSIKKHYQTKRKRPAFIEAKNKIKLQFNALGKRISFTFNISSQVFLIFYNALV